jgi:formiminotetrahydrofolate cyclodeaminase
MRSEELRATLTSRIEEDAEAYEAVLAAYRLPKSESSEAAARQAAIQQAMKRAVEVPLATAADALSAMDLAQEVIEVGLTSAVTDAATGAWMAMASVQAAALSVRSNLRAIEDQAFVTRAGDEVARLTSNAQERLARIETVTTRRMGS